MKKQFEEELQKTLYIHTPLPLHKENSLEAEFAGKKVTAKKCVWDGTAQGYEPVAQNEGRISIEQTEDGRVIRLKANMTADHWPAGAPADGDYTNYGSGAFSFFPGEENWEGYNRIHFQVFPRIKTGRAQHLNVGVRNEGVVKVPDRYNREGANVFDLVNREWNECIWEFAAMGRDKVAELLFYVFLSGQAVSRDDELVYDFRDIWLEQVEEPELEKGWECRKNTISLSTAGYFPEGKKTAVANLEETTFQVCAAMDHRVVLEKELETVKNERGVFQVLDFSELTQEGIYYLRAGAVRSPEFTIAQDLGEEAVWKLLNFVYCLRCGTPVPGKHQACHLDTLAEHNGVKLSFAGGWHDAGDVSQQAAQTGEMVHALFEAAEKYRHKPLLRARLLEEAEWGLDFVLRTRFGDGYRATSAGATRFTDGLMGTFDDVAVRVFDHSYENFLFSGIEAYACYALRDTDRELGEASLDAAKEDFDFAVTKFAQTGVDPAHMYEHTYNSGLSQYYAVIIWAASNLYLASKEERYANTAAKYADKLIACQEKGEAGLGFEGFFYRDESHQSIVHFNHQSREQQFMQALVLLCSVIENHENKPSWEEAIRRYAGYQKAILSNSAPYGMLPAGVFRIDEPEDKALFPYLHVAVDYEEAFPHYKEQLRAGKKLDEMHVLRNFPVWFSFKGNSAILLAGGIAGALAGKYLQDEEMLQIGREQLYWMWGKNPFGQSLQYGVGSRYGSQYGVLVGECTGEVPVGIETYEDEDIPYWPQNNNATFKEVWIGVACRMMWLLAAYADVHNE
ncbi:MAG: glycoside hydrolase family 9 protein [Eubacteriales bacterium]|nr:glycoside hydrolase family 9 protein [Eubacteriales bacterium]